MGRGFSYKAVVCYGRYSGKVWTQSPWKGRNAFYGKDVVEVGTSGTARGRLELVSGDG